MSELVHNNVLLLFISLIALLPLIVILSLIVLLSLLALVMDIALTSSQRLPTRSVAVQRCYGIRCASWCRRTISAA